MTKATSSHVRVPKQWHSAVRRAVLHAIALADFAMKHTRAFAANSVLQRVRLKAELDEKRAEVALLEEELRIKDARIAKLDARRRPHYPPVERLAIVALRAARAWSIAQTARRFLVEPTTIADWMRRLDEQGQHALVQVAAPVNRFPDFVRMMVAHLRVVSPMLGNKRIADILARAGLHLAASTVKRMLARAPSKPPARGAPASPAPSTERHRGPVRARAVHHTWQLDLSIVPTRNGLWCPWIPFALLQSWPFCWWIAVVIDHFSRRVISIEAYARQPSVELVSKLITNTVRAAQNAPKYLVTDLGAQFDHPEFRECCHAFAIRNRYASKDSIRATAIVERFFRSLKTERTRRVTISFRRRDFLHQLGTYLHWYHEHRPHQGLSGRTPNEVFLGGRPASRRLRFEPRTRWPAHSPCAAPLVRARAGPGRPLEIAIRFADGERRLPIVEIDRVA